MKKSKFNLTVIILSIFLLASADFVFADPAYPFPIDEVQPDGTMIQIQVKGDEYYGWTEDVNGYTITNDLQTKEWVYASQAADGSLQPTSYAVGKAMPQDAGISKGLKDRNYIQKAEKARAAMRAPSASDDTLIKAMSQGASPAPATPITKKNLVVMVEFSDTKFTYTRENFDDLMNKTGYNVSNALGCVREFFSATTYGHYNVEGVVTKIMTADKTAAYYAGSGGSANVRELVREIIIKLDNENFNFKQCSSNGTNLDGLTVIYAGRGQSTGGGAGTIWPHAWAISTYTTHDGVRVSQYNCSNEIRDVNGTMVGAGTISHEISHALFGLPDLYDTSSKCIGVGYFCLMGHGGHLSSGHRPALWSAWCKERVGVSSPAILPNNADITISDAALSDDIYKLSGPGFSSNEYFLIENRSGGGFDKSLPGSNTAGRGILIWHIDNSRSNNSNSPNLRVDVEEADGSNALATGKTSYGSTNHYFRANYNESFTDTTNPNSMSNSGTLPAGKPITLISVPGTTMTFRVGNGSSGQVAGSVTSISPVSAKRGTTVSMAINGANLLQGSTAKLTMGGNTITATNVTYNSAAKLTASFNVPSSAAVGQWNLTVSSSGYTSDIVKSGIFKVEGGMSISALSRTFGVSGTILNLQITGTDFENTATVKLTNGGTTIDGIVKSRNGTTSITADFDISSSVAHNTKFDLTVTNSGDSVTKTNAIVIYKTPSVTSISPASAKRGTTVSSMAINGANLLQGSTAKLTNGGNTITATNVTYTSASKLTASFPISASAAVGQWNLTVSSSGYISDIVKSGIFTVEGNMSISALSRAFGVSGTILNLQITGTDFENTATVKLTGGGTTIDGIVKSRNGTTSITADFDISSSVAHNTKFDLTVTNPSGDSITKTGAIVIYRTPSITSFTPQQTKTANGIKLTINGSNYVNGTTKLILRKMLSGETITPRIDSMTSTKITASFDADESMIGYWSLCLAVYENGPEYTALKSLSIITSNDTTSHTLFAYKGAVIPFPVKSVIGTENTGTATIPEKTFTQDVTVKIKQHDSFGEAKSYVADLAHTNIGVHIDSEGKIPQREIELKIPYTDDDIRGMDEESLVICRYDEKSGMWVPLKTKIDKQNKFVISYLDHLSVFSIMAIAKATDFNSIKYYPNPLQPSKGVSYSRMHFTNLPAESKIKIYTVLGQSVKKIDVDGSGMALWDGKNETGDPAASGVYIVYIEDKQGNKKRIKIAVER